jgi:hypothetical protein
LVIRRTRIRVVLAATIKLSGADPRHAVQPTSYLNHSYDVRSWLLTTDHKRVTILYLISTTLMFFTGGFLALLICLELPTPQAT